MQHHHISKDVIDRVKGTGLVDLCCGGSVLSLKRVTSQSQLIVMSLLLRLSVIPLPDAGSCRNNVLTCKPRVATNAHIRAAGNAETNKFAQQAMHKCAQ